jgi:hypothetical protein
MDRRFEPRVEEGTSHLVAQGSLVSHHRAGRSLAG